MVHILCNGSWNGSQPSNVILLQLCAPYCFIAIHRNGGQAGEERAGKESGLVQQCAPACDWRAIVGEQARCSQCNQTAVRVRQPVHDQQ